MLVASQLRPCDDDLLELFLLQLPRPLLQLSNHQLLFLELGPQPPDLLLIPANPPHILPLHPSHLLLLLLDLLPLCLYHLIHLAYLPLELLELLLVLLGCLLVEGLQVGVVLLELLVSLSQRGELVLQRNDAGGFLVGLAFL